MKNKELLMKKIAGLLLMMALLASIHAKAGTCYEATILSPSPFMGNNDEVFKLDDGTLWMVKYEYEYLYEYNPAVVICPDSQKLHINGKSLSVELIGHAKSRTR